MKTVVLPTRENYFFEIYTKGPDGTPGWDIKTGFVLQASDRDEAVARIARRFGAKFDCVIRCHSAGQQLYPVGDHPVLIRSR